MGKLIDLTGKKFGRLTVIKQGGLDKCGNVKWLCKCSCGRKIITVGRNLRRGHTKSCSCLSNEMVGDRSRERLINLTGEKFGRLTVIKRSHPNNKWKGIMWLCKCDCGKEKIINGGSLKTGETKSCGCLRNEIIGNRNRLDSGVASMRSLINSYKIRAKKWGIKYKLTEKQFANLTQKNCCYCGAKPSNIFKNKELNGNYIYNGLDRVNNTKDYTIDNVVPCCKQCNLAKKNSTLQEFRNWIKKVHDNFNKRR